MVLSRNSGAVQHGTIGKDVWGARDWACVDGLVAVHAQHAARDVRV